MKLTRRNLLMAGAAWLLADTAAADGWPERAIKLVIPYTAGGNSDAIARLLANRIAPALGQPIVVENRGGAGAVIGTQEVATAAGNGYVFLLAPTAVVAITPYVRKVPYVPETALRPVAMVSGAYTILTARKGLPATPAAFVAYAKDHPEGVTFASSGLGTTTDFAGEVLAAQAGIKMLHVPFKGASEAVNALLGGQVDVMFGSGLIPYIKNGSLTAIAVAGPRRHPDLPDVPTLAEAGWPVDDKTWFGIFAPKGTPDAIVDRMAGAIQKVMGGADVKPLLLTMGQYPDFRGPAEFARQIKSDTAHFRGLIEQLHIKLD